MTTVPDDEAIRQAFAARQEAAGAVPEDGDPLPGEPLTELGYARRLSAAYGDRVRYVPAWKRWLTWDGTRWRDDADGEVARLAKNIALRVSGWCFERREEDGGKGKLARAMVMESARSRSGPAPSRALRWSRASWTPTRSCSTRRTARWTCAPGSCGAMIRPT